MICSHIQNRVSHCWSKWRLWWHVDVAENCWTCQGERALFIEQENYCRRGQKNWVSRFVISQWIEPSRPCIRLVSEVFPQAELMDEVLKVAKEIAKAPQLALRRIKANLNEADESLSFSNHLDVEADRHARSGSHPDAAEAGRAFIGKRAPKFVGVGKQDPWRVAKL